MRSIKGFVVSLLFAAMLVAPTARAEVEFKPVSVYWAHTASVTNIATLSGLSLVGGLLMTDNQIALLTAQTDGRDNGAWQVHAGAWVRMFPSAVNDSMFYIRKGLNTGVCGGRDWRAVDAVTGLEKSSVWFCN